MVYNPDADGWFEARELVCAGCAAQQNGIPGRDKAKPTPGGKLYVVDTRPPDLELAPWSLPSRPQDQAPDEQPDAE